MVDLGDLEQVAEEADRERQDAQVVCIHDHDPVLDEVRPETLLPDERHDPIYRRVQLAVLHFLAQTELLFVAHHIQPDVDDRPELLVFAECEEERRVLVTGSYHDIYGYRNQVEGLGPPLQVLFGHSDDLLVLEVRGVEHLDRVGHVPAA